MSIDIKALHETLGDIIAQSLSANDHPATTRGRLRGIQDSLKPHLPIEEPTNLGAVVRTSEGNSFVRTERDDEALPWILVGDGEAYNWSDVTGGVGVTILSHGYTEEP